MLDIFFFFFKYRKWSVINTEDESVVHTADVFQYFCERKHTPSRQILNFPILGNFQTSDRWSIPTSWSRSLKADLFPILYDIARGAGWNPYNLHDIAHVSFAGSVLCRSCTIFHNGRWRTRWSRSWSVCPTCFNFLPNPWASILTATPVRVVDSRATLPSDYGLVQAWNPQIPSDTNAACNNS